MGELMADLGADFFVIFVLMLFQIVLLGIFITLYVRKKQGSFLSLIFSVVFFITSNALTLAFIQRELWALDFFQALLAAAGLAPIVVFLEIFENGVSFTQRSSLSIVFIIVVGAIKGASELFEPRIGEFINLMAPIMFILVGAFYLNTIKKMKGRIRFENQKSKIRKMRVGIYLTFIIPKFLIGALIALTVLPVMLSLIPNVTIFEGYDVSFLQKTETVHIFDMLLNTIQTIGLVIMTLPIVYSRSVFFMQSRKVTRLIVINKDGVPVFEFPFEQVDEDEAFDEEMLTEAYAAISTIMTRGGLATQQLKTINFSELQLITEIRDGFAIVLIADRPTKFLVDSLENFADQFQDIFPTNARLNEIRTQKLKYTAEKMVQKSFDLEDEEFEQIRIIVSEGYDKVAGEYLKRRSEEDPEIKLLPDFMKRLPVGSRVLDAGCGAGEPITRLLSEKFKVTGVDISKKQIEIARENLPICEFIWQDMTTLTFPDEYFDGIISNYAITHIPREEHKGFLENLYRMLKNNGIALLCFGTSDDPGTVVDDFFGVKMYWSSFDAGTNIEMLKEVGFHVIWLKLILDDITEEQHIFILARKLDTDFLEVIDAMEDVEDKVEVKLITEEEIPEKQSNRFSF